MSIDPIGIRISGPLAGFAEGYGTELTQLDMRLLPSACK
jgi:hypothetical protein